MRAMKFVFLLLIFSPTVFAECKPLVGLSGFIDLKRNRWTETYRTTKSEKICIDVNAENATLMLEFSKGKNKYSQKVFSSLIGYYDYIDKKKNELKGGTFPAKSLSIHAWAPEWIKGSKMRVSEIYSKKTIIEVQL